MALSKNVLPETTCSVPSRRTVRSTAVPLCAPTAFGKTVTAAALIAARGVNTLILVHRAELLRQWRDVEEHTLVSAEEKMVFKLPRQLTE